MICLGKKSTEKAQSYMRDFLKFSNINISRTSQRVIVVNIVSAAVFVFLVVVVVVLLL